MRSYPIATLGPLGAAFLLCCLVAVSCGSTAPLDSVVTAQGQETQPETPQPTQSPAQPTQLETEAPVRLWIKPYWDDCGGESPEQHCLRVARSEDGDYEYFSDEIQGFYFEEGTSYILDVVIDEIDDPSADGSSLRYTLLDLVEPEIFPTSFELACAGELASREISDYSADAVGSATIEEALAQYWASAPDVRAGLRETIDGSRVSYDYRDDKPQLILRFTKLNDTWLLGIKEECHDG